MSNGKPEKEDSTAEAHVQEPDRTVATSSPAEMESRRVTFLSCADTDMTPEVQNHKI